MAIQFHSEVKNFKIFRTRSLKNWFATTIYTENKQAGDINFIIVDDNYLLALNQQYLKHNTYTDIITFDYSEKAIISGEVFISIDRVRENSEKFDTTSELELYRVMIHGILHLCGYKDKTSADKRLMRQKEDYYLSLCPL